MEAASFERRVPSMPLINRLRDHLDARADEAPAVALLQPAEPFLDTVGEAMRRRLFLTEDGAGRLMCLRPEFTIPLCLHHIGSDAIVGTCYAGTGPVFRQGRRAGGHERSEFPQAGLEFLGHMNASKADRDAVTAMLDALDVAGASEREVTLGDKALFAALLSKLDLTDTWRNRLARAFGNADAMDGCLHTLASPSAGAPRDDTERLAVDGDAPALEAKVRALMEAGGISPGAGRDPAVVARRTIERTRDARVRLDPFALHALRSFLAIDMALPDALRALETLADQSELDLADALRSLQERMAPLEGVRGDLHFRAGFGRPLDYYTGLLFEARVGGVAVAGGGRYDALGAGLGADRPVPAVGFTLAVDLLDAL